MCEAWHPNCGREFGVFHAMNLKRKRVRLNGFALKAASFGGPFVHRLQRLLCRAIGARGEWIGGPERSAWDKWSVAFPTILRQQWNPRMLPGKMLDRDSSHRINFTYDQSLSIIAGKDHACLVSIAQPAAVITKRPDKGGFSGIETIHCDLEHI